MKRISAFITANAAWLFTRIRVVLLETGLLTVRASYSRTAAEFHPPAHGSLSNQLAKCHNISQNPSLAIRPPRQNFRTASSPSTHQRAGPQTLGQAEDQFPWTIWMAPYQPTYIGSWLGSPLERGSCWSSLIAQIKKASVLCVDGNSRVSEDLRMGVRFQNKLELACGLWFILHNSIQ